MKKQIIIKTTGERAEVLYGKGRMTILTKNRAIALNASEVADYNLINRVLYPSPEFLEYFEMNMNEYQQFLRVVLGGAITIVAMTITYKILSLCQ
jgi:hypothetical protein